MPTMGQMKRPIIVSHTIRFGVEDDVRFDFDSRKFNDAFFREWKRLDAENPEALNTALAEVLVGWDIVNDDGTPLPPTAEAISAIFSLLDKGRIVGELVKASAPSEAEGKASPAPTSTQPTASSSPPETPQNGTAASPSQPPSASPSLI